MLIVAVLLTTVLIRVAIVGAVTYLLLPQGPLCPHCRAEMVAIRLFNDREGTPLPAVFGCVTSGSIWRFLKLEKSTLFIDLPEYYPTVRL